MDSQTDETKERYAAFVEHICSGGFDGQRRSLSALARETGIPRSYFVEVRRLRVTQPGIEKVKVLCRVYGIDANALIDALTDPGTPFPVKGANRRDGLSEQEVEQVRALLRFLGAAGVAQAAERSS